jgi:hypothetical protein
MYIDEVIQARLNEFKRHCLSTSDSVAKAWVFHGGPTSPGLLGHHTFGLPTAPLRIHLLDLYHGRTPTLVNLATLRGSSGVIIGLVPFLILDSNAISYVHGYVNGKIDDPLRRDVVEQFMAFIFERQLDPVIVFYFLESLARSDKSRWREQARAYAETLFNLQTLDRELFLKDRRLASSIQRRQLQLASKNESAASGLMERYLDSIPLAVAEGEGEKIDLSYAALLKATLLRMIPQLSTSERLARLGDFMVDRLGAVLGVERSLATLHWLAPERFARLMTPLQIGVRTDKLLSKLKSTAWDLYLGRLPEQLGRFLSTSDPGEADALCNMYYIATGEDALADLLRQRTIGMLLQYPDPAKSTLVVGHQSTILEDLVDSAELERIHTDSTEWERSAAKTAHLRKPITGEQLNSVISELEAEIMTFATRRGKTA